jgi:UDP-glucuronate 4-epimerase
LASRAGRDSKAAGSFSSFEAVSEIGDQKEAGQSVATILVTGTAGFIGFHLTRRLLNDGHRVIGFDNVNDYYATSLKRDRLAQIPPSDRFQFVEADLVDRSRLERIFVDQRIDRVVHLAAQAGVRYSIENPHAYIESNIVGFMNILESCRHHHVEHLVYASSSSVYGATGAAPFSEHRAADHPVSLYAATKRSNELMAHTYSHLYGLPATGLRFFTVYGPWGRPDMALFLFTQAILEDKPIKVFNHGKMQRDFTYVDDIVEGIVRVLHHVPAPQPDWDRALADPATSYAPHRVYNIGNSNPVELLTFIQILEQAIGKPARKEMLPFQPGDVPATHADMADLERDVDFRPRTSLEEGVSRFVAWYRDYYQVS